MLVLLWTWPPPAARPRVVPGPGPDRPPGEVRLRVRTVGLLSDGLGTSIRFSPSDHSSRADTESVCNFVSTDTLKRLDSNCRGIGLPTTLQCESSELTVAAHEHFCFLGESVEVKEANGARKKEPRYIIHGVRGWVPAYVERR